MTQIELRIDSGQIGAVFRAVLLACKHSNRITIEQTKRTAAAIVLQGKRGTENEKEREREGKVVLCMLSRQLSMEFNKYICIECIELVELAKRASLACVPFQQLIRRHDATKRNEKAASHKLKISSLLL